MYPGAGSMGGMPPTGPGQHGMGTQSPMNSPMQQQRRIDPDQMPSPVGAMKWSYMYRVSLLASCNSIVLLEKLPLKIILPPYCTSVI